MKTTTWIVAAVLFGTIGVAACGGAQEQKEAAAPGSTAQAAQGEVCPTLDPGPPPACPAGCVWNGTECRKNRPIVIVDTPPPPLNTSPSATSTGIVAPVQPPHTSP